MLMSDENVAVMRETMMVEEISLNDKKQHLYIYIYIYIYITIRNIDMFLNKNIEFGGDDYFNIFD